MNTPPSPEDRDPDLAGTTRLETFSDGAFAIITLLVLKFTAPMQRRDDWRKNY